MIERCSRCKALVDRKVFRVKVTVLYKELEKTSRQIYIFDSKHCLQIGLIDLARELIK